MYILSRSFSDTTRKIKVRTCANSLVSFNRKKIKKNPGKKYLYKVFEVYLANMLAKGLIFFHLTINFQLFNVNLDYNVFERVILGKDTYPLKEYNVKYSECLFFILRILDFKAEFLDVALCSIENSEELDNPHTHILLGFRAISDDYVGIETLLKNILIEHTIDDFVLNYLKGDFDIKKAFRYLTKDFDKKRESDGFFCIMYSPINYDMHDDAWGLMFESLLFPKCPASKDITGIEETTQFIRFYEFASTHVLFKKETRNYNKTMLLNGYKFDSKENKVFLCIYYLSLYFQMKEMFLYKGNLYQKVKGSIIGIKLLGDLNYLQNNVMEYIEDLTKELFSLSFMDLAKFCTLNLENFIKKIDQLSYFNKTKIDYSILEFNDGLYFANYDKFISREVIKEELIVPNFYTLRYYNISYKKYIIKNLKKTLWEKKILSQFDNESKVSFKDFLAIFANVLFSDSLEESHIKKNVLFILGVSNSGKTSFSMDIASMAYGEQNVGTFNSDIKFLLDNIQNKDIILGDEIKYNKSVREVLLKVLSGELVNVNAKFKSSTHLRLSKNIILASNRTEQIERLLNDKAFLNRINLILFNKEVELSHKDRQTFRKEIPLILIRCARSRRRSNSEYQNRKLARHFKSYISSLKKSRGVRLNNRNLPTLIK